MRPNLSEMQTPYLLDFLESYIDCRRIFFGNDGSKISTIVDNKLFFMFIFSCSAALSFSYYYQSKLVYILLDTSSSYLNFLIFIWFLLFQFPLKAGGLGEKLLGVCCEVCICILTKFAVPNVSAYLSLSLVPFGGNFKFHG